MRPPVLRIHTEELIVDSFAGGGGASLGIETALGRSPDIAINHDPEAIAMHAANHPATRHYCENVWAVDPVKACAGRRVALAWFSPDCKHHSKAKGGKPRDAKIRGLAWVANRWARAVKPRVICLENVEEFAEWGPLLADGNPDPMRKSLTFRIWVGKIRAAGYEVQWRELRACDYGAPTTRKRLFVIARSDGLPIVWPSPTHGPGRIPYRTAAECMDWSLECPSIFGRERPLAEATLRRIARGMRRYVLEARDPFVVSGLVAPTLIQQSWGERKGQAPRCLDIQAPLGTVVGGGIKHALVAAFLARHYGGHENDGAPLQMAIPTITAKDHHALVTAQLGHGSRAAEVRAFLLAYYGTDQDPQLRMPLHTVTTKDRFGLVTIHGQAYEVADIGMRMLAPRELYRAQGFPDSYQIAPEYQGAPLTKTAQVRMAGNSVCPPIAAAIVRAQFAEPVRASEVA